MTTSAPRKKAAAPRRRTPPAAAPQQPAAAPQQVVPANVVTDPGSPPLNLDALPERAAVPLVHLFTLDQRDYYVPQYMTANVTLQYLEVLRDQGASIARAWLLQEALGQEAYDALKRWDGLTSEVLVSLVERVLTRSEGPMEAVSRPLGRG